jgi:ATP-dependent DNA ligase
MRYEVPSSSSDVVYTVTMAGKKATWCTCIGFKFSKGLKSCRHTRAVEANAKPYRCIDKTDDGPAAAAQPTTFRVSAPEFVKPMLASAVDPDTIDFDFRKWAVEEKYDGHRLIASVQDGMVVAWARSGLRRELPSHLEATLAKFPNGTYDGELCIPHGRSYNVTEVDRASERTFVVFDIVRALTHNVTKMTYEVRRQCLTEIFNRCAGPGVALAESTNVKSWDEVEKLCGEIWDRDGEGVIVKDRQARYEVGKRSKSFIKVKALRSAALTITGWKAGLLGPQSICLLEDSKGNKTRVKVRNAALLRQIEKRPSAFIGRELRIDYQERTPDGSYRHPRWDRFEDE